MSNFSITSPDQFIQADIIDNGCEIIKKSLTKYESCQDKLKFASEICNEKVLSLDGKTLQPSIDEIVNGIDIVKNNITTFADSISSTAHNILSQQEAEYQRYLAYLDSLRESKNLKKE